MRIRGVVFLLLWAVVSSCADNEGPESDGTLVVWTATTGTDPDPDGYVLTVDGTGPVTLDPADTARLDVSSGGHVLRLLGVADHCVVDPGVQLEVDVPAQDTADVPFQVNCQATGAQVSVVTSGVDRDPNGYRVVVDGTDRGQVPVTGAVLTRLGTGPHTIGLQGLAANCSLGGQGPQTVTIGPSEVVTVDFAVVCTALTGVVKVRLADGAEDGAYEARIDGGAPYPLGPTLPAYVENVVPGTHVVSLTAPDQCVVEQPTQSVTVSAGTPVRDTADVIFAVRCEPTRFRITAPTTGPVPSGSYSVWLCDTSWYCYYNGPYLLGNLTPNGTLVGSVVAAPHLAYSVELRDVPANCRVEVQNPTDPIAPAAGDTTDIAFPVRCSP